MRRNRLERTAAAFLALLLQAGLVAFVRLARESEGESKPDPDLILIQAIHVVEVAPLIEDRRDAAPSRKTAPASRPREAPRIPPPEPGAAITVPTAPAQTVDWTRAMEEAARRIVQQDSDREQRGLPLDSKPRVLELPKRPSVDPNKPGTVTVLPNGDVRVQFEKRLSCIYSRPGLAEHFDAWAKGRPPKCTRKREVPEAVNLDAVKPDYLRRPLPEPPLPQTPLPVLD